MVKAYDNSLKVNDNPAIGFAVVSAILGKSDFVKRCNRMDVTKIRTRNEKYRYIARIYKTFKVYIRIQG